MKLFSKKKVKAGPLSLIMMNEAVDKLFEVMRSFSSDEYGCPDLSWTDKDLEKYKENK